MLILLLYPGKDLYIDSLWFRVGQIKLKPSKSQKEEKIIYCKNRVGGQRERGEKV